MAKLTFEQIGELLKQGSNPSPEADVERSPEEEIREVLEKSAADQDHNSQLSVAKLLIALDILD